MGFNPWGLLSSGLKTIPLMQPQHVLCRRFAAFLAKDSRQIFAVKSSSYSRWWVVQEGNKKQGAVLGLMVFHYVSCARSHIQI